MSELRASVQSRRPGLRAQPLTVRLAVLTGLLTAAAVAVAFFALSFGIQRRTEGLLAEQLRITQRAAIDAQRAALRQTLGASLLLGESPTLRAAMQEYRLDPGAQARRTIQGVLNPLTGAIDQELVVVTDDDGTVLAATVRGVTVPISGLDLSTLPAVRRALDGSPAVADSSFGIIEVSGMRFYAGCAPILQAGYLIGALLVGESVETGLLPRLVQPDAGELVIRTDDAVLASTLDSVASLEAGGAGVLARAATAPRGIRLGGQQFVVAAMPLAIDARGQVVSLYHLRSLTAAAGAFRRVLIGNFLLYGTLAVTLATLAAALVSRSVLRSFGEFVRFMGNVAQRRSYASQFDASSAPPEIQKLSATYDQLIASLAESDAQLNEREEQLRQSQRLEAIGTLAGGVAHDFNNVLTVIHSYTELLMGTVEQGTPTWADLDQIRQAASRAALLTTQLLAFSRKQVLQPRVIDLNGIVNGIDQMLRRIIGEHIDLQTLRASGLARVKADPGQVEQVLMNLAINARDAMPRGGRLTIETSNIHIAEAAPAQHGETPPGHWVLLTVRDNGIGMSRETMARIFEPFFTTKPVGRGTGLGLAMVYGIVKQSGGFIWVSSEPGQGTTFRVYLPPVEGLVAADEGGTVPAASAHGVETILLVEDEALVRALAQRALRERGYTVLAAADGNEALDILADEPDRKIDLLLTDVIMPHMGGKELADAIRAQRPATRVLFMSGHTDDAIVHQGILDDGVVLLPKPFTPSQLTRKVREVLDATAATRA